MSISQSQFTEKGFEKTDNSQHSMVLLLFLFTLERVNLNGDNIFRHSLLVTLSKHGLKQEGCILYTIYINMQNFTVKHNSMMFKSNY